MSLAGLPQPILSDILHLAALQGSVGSGDDDVATTILDATATAAGVRAVASLALVSRAARDCVRQANLHRHYTRRIFGPLDYAAYFQARGGCGEPGPAAWRDLLMDMAGGLQPRLASSIKQGTSWLRERELLGGSASHHLVAGVGMVTPNDPSKEHKWLHWLILNGPLQLRRRIAAYICLTSELHPKYHLDAFIGRFRLVPSPEQREELGDDNATSPLAVLRRTLLQFPFLPIDAGGGADRTIGALAREYVKALPHCVEWLGQSVDQQHYHKDAVEAVHLVIYSLIMLNTDLHNPAVQPKMALDEFQDSLYRVPLLQTLNSAHIARMYESVRDEPLRIERDRIGVDSIIRSAADGADDEVSPALVSRYHGGCAAVLMRCCPGRHFKALTRLRPGQLRSAAGRADLRFQLKRWHGRHYTKIRILGLVLVLATLAYELMLRPSFDTSTAAFAFSVSDTLAQASALPFGLSTVSVAIVVHVATRGY